MASPLFNSNELLASALLYRLKRWAGYLLDEISMDSIVTG
jgi:hypothetical protein